jgi:6-methylsalicylate decarboxylase
MHTKGLFFSGDDHQLSPGSGLLSRRTALQGLGALGAGAALKMNERSAHAQAPNPRRLDLHHHYCSPGWLAFLIKNDALRPLTGMDVIPRFKAYSPEKAIEAMDKAGVATSFLSVTTPGIWFGNIDDTRRVARELNEYATKVKSDNKGRFGVFAVLPLPDVDASLREIEYAYDTLKVDGISFVSSFRDRWLGDEAFGPMWDELNRRQAVVYTHSTAPDCCLLNFQPKVGNTVIEFNADVSRSIVSVIESGTANRTPNVKYIWSHGGGSIFASRYLGAAASKENLPKPAAQNSKLFHLRRFYYDTAAATDVLHLELLRDAVGMSQVVFGTDFPWGTPANIAAELQKSGLTPEELRGIDRENALRILPKYKG